MTRQRVVLTPEVEPEAAARVGKVAARGSRARAEDKSPARVALERRLMRARAGHKGSRARPPSIAACR